MHVLFSTNDMCLGLGPITIESPLPGTQLPYNFATHLLQGTQLPYL